MQWQSAVTTVSTKNELLYYSVLLSGILKPWLLWSSCLVMVSESQPLILSTCQLQTARKKRSCGQIHINFYDLPSTIPTEKLLPQKNPREEESVAASTLDSFQSIHLVTLKFHVTLTVVYYQFLYLLHSPVCKSPPPPPHQSPPNVVQTASMESWLQVQNRTLLVVSTAPQGTISSKSTDAFVLCACVFCFLSLSLQKHLAVVGKRTTSMFKKRRYKRIYIYI